jgi:hypothetical protein
MKEGAGMPEYVERLMRCGVNLIDAYEICDDYMYDGDYQGLADYVREVELDCRMRADYVGIL